MYMPTNSKLPERLPERSSASLPGLIFYILLGMLVIAFFLFLLITERNRIPREDRVPAAAVITEIRSHLEGKVMKRDVFVRYTAEGRELESRTGDYIYGMRAGDSVRIYYDRNHPFKIQIRGITRDIAWLLALALFALFTILHDCKKAAGILRARRKKRTDSDEA